MDSTIVAIKSQFGAEFRRFSLNFAKEAEPNFEDFVERIASLHHLTEDDKASILLSYISSDGTSLPISNNTNLHKAFDSAKKLLRVRVQRKGESLEEQHGYGLKADVLMRKKNHVAISQPQDFRRVSSILDADVLPRELRRVQLCKYYNNKPLGFFIRNGFSEQFTPWGPVQTPGIFISRLLEHGLAASTNLLNVNDEILEVNGIDVRGKTLDQVTDVMIANAASLVLTVRPFRPNPYFGAMPPNVPPDWILFPPPPPPFASGSPRSRATPPRNTPPPRFGSPSSYGTMPRRHHEQGADFGPPMSYIPSPAGLPRYSVHEDAEYAMYRYPQPMPPPPPFPHHHISAASSNFSRDSTWRISDKISQMHLSGMRHSPGAGGLPRSHQFHPRPYSIHVADAGPISHMPYYAAY